MTISSLAMQPIRDEPASASGSARSGRSAGLATASPLDVERVRADFPQLATCMHGAPLVYLDSAASTLKPQAVIDRISRFYSSEYANIHRGVYSLSSDATDAYEGARARVARFLGATETREIVFTRGTTEAINLVAQTFGRRAIGAGDEVVVSALEHHANIVPWQMVCEAAGARLRVIPMNDRGELLIDQLPALLSERTRMVAVTHVSNALGTINPIAEIVRQAKAAGAAVLIDGAQAALHAPVNVAELGCDFYVFSGHKVLGPTGIGALYAKASVLEGMPPYQGGGDMIQSVTFEKTTYREIPHRFEAGTPHIAGAVGLAAALDYLDGLGREAVVAHEAKLLAYGTERLQQIPGLTIVGQAARKAGVLSFTLGDAHPHDVGTILDLRGIAIRAGHHCAQPVMDRLGLMATARASIGPYNTEADLDRLVEGLAEVAEVFG